MTTDNIVEIEDLTVDFSDELGTTRAIDALSLRIRRGKVTAIVGESGSGKTVTAYSILKLISRPGRITRGTITFNPRNAPSFDTLSLAENEDKLYSLRGGHASMVFQEPMSALSPVHTIGDQVMESLITHSSITREEARLKTEEMLERVGLMPGTQRFEQYPFELSGGMRQRAVIAMAMICSPELLICDEPTTALDVTVQAEILTLIKALNDSENMSIMFITHDLGVVAQIADEVIVMRSGRIVETGSVREIINDPLHPYTRHLIAAARGEISEDISRDWESQPLMHIAGNRSVALTQDQLETRSR